MRKALVAAGALAALTLTGYADVNAQASVSTYPYCHEDECDPVQQPYISHFTGPGCTGREAYYTPYYNYDGVRRSWDGNGITGRKLRRMTAKSYKRWDGLCFDAWPSGNTLDNFVLIFRDWCGEATCRKPDMTYISHFYGPHCLGQEAYWTRYGLGDEPGRPWDGLGVAGTIQRTLTHRSWKGADGVCHDDWPDGNTLDAFVIIYRDPFQYIWYCGEANCNGLGGAYISHFTELGCTGTESYYTPYFGNDGIRRSWDGQGLAGTMLRTVTNKSYKYNGTCYDAWPNGNQLSGFVTIYRP